MAKAAVILLCALILTACDPIVHVEARIRNQQQRPISSAQIVVRNSKGNAILKGTSDSSGCFVDTRIASFGDYYLDVTVPAYKPLTVSLPSRVSNVDVTLATEGSEESSSAVFVDSIDCASVRGF